MLKEGRRCWRRELDKGRKCWRREVEEGSRCWRREVEEGRRCWRREVEGLWNCRMCSRRGECAGGVEEWLGHDNMLCIRKDD